MVQGRRNVSKVIRKCFKCRRQLTKPLVQKMAPSSLERVCSSLQFAHVGLDITGHLFLKQKGNKVLQKAYVCIFTCAPIRMVHLELTNDMTTEEFLQAFKRMCSRRDLCNTIWSDNQSTFKRADKDLKRIIESSNVKVEKVWEKLDKLLEKLSKHT